MAPGNGDISRCIAHGIRIRLQPLGVFSHRFALGVDVFVVDLTEKCVSRRAYNARTQNCIGRINRIRLCICLHQPARGEPSTENVHLLFCHVFGECVAGVAVVDWHLDRSTGQLVYDAIVDIYIIFRRLAIHVSVLSVCLCILQLHYIDFVP